MAIRQVITFRLKPGAGRAFLEGFSPIVDKVRLEDGCEQYDLYAHVSEPEVFVMLERWRDLSCLEGALRKLYKGPDDPGVAFLKDVVETKRERFEVAP